MVVYATVFLSRGDSVLGAAKYVVLRNATSRRGV